MGLSETQQSAVAEFTRHFENAVIGMQLNDSIVETVLPRQFAVCLGAAIYAAQNVIESQLDLPPLADAVNFSDFLSATQGHYAETFTLAASTQAEQVLAGVDMDKLKAMSDAEQ